MWVDRGIVGEMKEILIRISCGLLVLIGISIPVLLWCYGIVCFFKEIDKAAPTPIIKYTTTEQELITATRMDSQWMGEVNGHWVCVSRKGALPWPGRE